MRKQGKIFYGWWVVLGLFIIGVLGPMGRFSMTPFFPFILTDTGWTRSTIGFAQSLTMWVYAIFVIPVGWMIDRIGGRKTILIGGFLTFGAWILLSIVRAPWELYIYYGVIMALAVAMTHYVPTQVVARKWFIKRAGLINGIIITAAAVGQSVFIPLFAVMASSSGWRATSIIIAFAFGAAILLSALFLIRDTPESMGLRPYGEASGPASVRGQAPIEVSWHIGNALRTSQFWLLFIGYGLMTLPWMGLLGHVVMWGTDLGSSAATAGMLGTMLTLPSIATRIGGGWLGDRYGKKRIIIISNSLALLLMLWAWQSVHTMQSLMVFAVLYGPSHFLQMGLYTPYLGDLFGRANIGFLFSILTMGVGVIAGFGPMVWGKIFEISGSYNPAGLVSAVCYAITIVAILLIRPRRKIA